MDYTNRLISQQQTPLNPNPNFNFSSIPHTQLHHQPLPPLPQPSFSTHLSSHTTNPNVFLSFPQPVLPSEPLLHAPGTDPFANSGSYPSTHVGLGSHFQFSEDPNAASQNWVFKQAEPIRYEAVPASNSLHENSIVSTSLTSLWNNYWANQALANDATKIIPKQNKVVQSMWCEVCKIDCNSKEVYEKHIQGKKHQKHLQVQLSSMGGQVMFGVSGVATGEDLDTKKRKLLNGSAAVDSVRVCTICNVTCNSLEVFNKHLAGKRHTSQAGLISLDGVGPHIAAVRSQASSTWNKFPVKNKVVQSAWCEVCKINCNSSEVYIKHLSGKKHLKNLEKLSKPMNDVSAPASNALPAPTNPIIGPMENPDANKGKSVAQISVKVAESQAPKEDLEAKRRKVLEGGAAAGAVRTCTICNVVCNSQTVFDSHLAGQKHTAMVKKKQAEAGIAMPGPQLITAT